MKSDLPPGGLLPLHHEAAVEPVNSNQLVMGALLNDLTVTDNKNLVGMAHGFQPVGNHNDRLIVGQFRNGLHQLLFIFGVNIGSGFVQNNDRRIVMLILLIPRVKKSKNPGSIYPLYMASYGAFRFIDEFFRMSSTWMLFHLSHVWAAIAFAAGLSIYMLAEKKSAEPGVLRVSTEKNLYQCLNLQIKSDLFVSSTEGVTLFEAKAGGSKAEDLYQLRMYHDGCVADDMEVREAVLIAQRHPDTVKALLAELNRQKDKKGRPYHFALTTWDEQGIALPPDAA